jgi:hypothetical protein
MEDSLAGMPLRREEQGPGVREQVGMKGTLSEACLIVLATARALSRVTWVPCDSLCCSAFPIGMRGGPCIPAGQSSDISTSVLHWVTYILTDH